MAQRLGVDSQGLQQLVADSPWDDAALWGEIRCKVIPALGRLEAWIVDETGWLKQGKDSAGGSHQYCGAVGKQANCQVCVEISITAWSCAPWPTSSFSPSSRGRKKLLARRGERSSG